MSDVASILDDTDTVDTPKQNVGQHRNNRKNTFTIRQKIMDARNSW